MSSLMTVLFFLSAPAAAVCSEAQTAVMNKLFFEGFPGGNMDVLDEIFHPGV